MLIVPSCIEAFLPQNNNEFPLLTEDYVNREFNEEEKPQLFLY